MTRHDTDPFHVEHLVESEHRAGLDLAWLVVGSIVLCVLAIVYSSPDALLRRIDDADALNVNGILALVVVVPLAASFFAFRRYRDAVGAQRELTHLSLHDALTGLPNRRHLREVLPGAFRQARRDNAKAGIFFIDLDGFKTVNDTHGHEVGDRLMAAVARRLILGAGEERWVARYAGDEFVIIDPAPPTPEHCVRFARDLVTLIEQPFELGEDRIAISASVGVAFGDHTSDPDEVLADADAAMYDAKNSANRTAVFSDSMRSRLTPTTAEKRLEQALQQGEFRLLYQPIVALRTSRIVGAEALLRWDDPERGMISPRDFLGALEETGLIVPVGRWVAEEACRQAARWHRMTPADAVPLRVTFNVSPRQLGQSDFVDDLQHALDSSGVEPGSIYLEVAETALTADARAVWSAMERLGDTGVGVALDDFGSGYSSLSHLRSFDLELLKLDGSSIAGLGEESGDDDDVIVRHVVSLARGLGIATVAEGVRTARQVERLLEFGCELGQGFLFSEPQPPTIIDEMVRQQTAVPGVRTSVSVASPVEGSDTGPASVVLPRLRRADAAT